MPISSRHVQNTYIALTVSSTLAASLIWGVNTLFLLDAGLSNLEAFAANAFFTAGQVIFEVPTGVIADTWGRRVSYLLGVATLFITTLLYVYLWQASAPFWQWAIVSALLGLGFTFFSGATEAWLVDALHFTGYKGELEAVFAKGQIALGVAMLGGAISGGFIAQLTNLGGPYVLRVVLLGISFLIAAVFMRDLGFSPKKNGKPIAEMKRILSASIDHGWRNPPVKWLMLAAPFSAGVGIYGFYALQPYLLQLYGDSTAYGLAGLAAAIVAGAQIAGGFSVKFIHRLFQRRTNILIGGVIFSAMALLLIGLVPSFWFVLFMVVLWGVIYAATGPVRQTYLNGLIPSDQRATVLSFDALMGSSGGVVFQPLLGRAADMYSYATSYVAAAAIQLAALPFSLLARRTAASSDLIKHAK